MKYVMMEMPGKMKVALPVDEDEMIEERLLLILRDQAWTLYQQYFPYTKMDYLSLISTPLRFAVAMTVFLRRQLIVIGPTPPGTGVIKLAFSLTCEKSTSPTIRYFPISFF